MPKTADATSAPSHPNRANNLPPTRWLGVARGQARKKFKDVSPNGPGGAAGSKAPGLKSTKHDSHQARPSRKSTPPA